ncbi:RhoGEF domain-containing protein [Tieghemostelium lacteum]|uniref:RhoGEF domain-containing protein n=1 Tax=Tieghemostelium lacteum TaxID=361077 RepID=A0A151Z919_TIELA|nr:RhoGEF domain-containing protein [Tieghemostelium lacteum]|eukprot:KYQ90426.1 RhoGEF domain-containing protein [Tieghemostelium lacteum]
MNEDWSTETQKKVYTIWANNILQKRNLSIIDLFEDLRDGVLLINLLEILTSEKSVENYNSKPSKNRLQQLSNAQIALNIIDRWGIHLVNFRPEHLVDKNTKMILSLIWRVISRFQIQQHGYNHSLLLGDEILDSESDVASDDGTGTTTSTGGASRKSIGRTFTSNNLMSSTTTPSTISSTVPSSASTLSASARTAKEVLLRWCKKELELYPNISITNFNKSFQNPQIFYCLVHKFLPTHLDLDSYLKEDDIIGLAKCLDIAEKQLSIPQLLSAQQIIEGPIDENCIMTYVSYYLNYQRNGTTIPIVINIQQQQQPLEKQLSTQQQLEKQQQKEHQRSSSNGSDKVLNSPTTTSSTPITSTTNAITGNPLNNSSTRSILKRTDTMTPEKPQNGGLFSTPINSPHTERSPARPHPILQRQLSSSQIQPNNTNINNNTNVLLNNNTLMDILQTFTLELKRITEEHEVMIIKTTAKLDEKVTRLGDKLDQLEGKILSIKEVVDSQQLQQQLNSHHHDDHQKKRHSKKTQPIVSPIQTSTPVTNGLNNDNTLNNNTAVINNNSTNNATTTTTTTTTKSKDKQSKEERREKRRSRRKEKEEKRALAAATSQKTDAGVVQQSLSPSSSSCSLTDDAQIDREELKKIIRVQSVARGFLARKQYKRIRNRRGVALEILKTEESYVANLRVLLQDYLIPLKAESNNHPSLIDNVKTLYNNIEVILNMNNMLLMKLKERMSKPWHYQQLYGDIFFKMSDLLKCYIAYVNLYNRTLNTLNDFTKITALNEIISSTFIKTRQQLRDLVIIPVQRIPRYVLLLEELVKVTENSHPDHILLVQSLTKMQSIADHVNEKRRDFENVTHVSLLQEAIIGFNIMEYSSLRYVMEGDLQSHVFSSGSGFGNAIAGVVNNAVSGTSTSNSDLTKGQSTILHVFLFNQMIVVCKYKKGKDSYFSNKNLFGSSNEKHKSKQPKYKYMFHHLLNSDTKISHNKSENWFGIDNNGEYRRFFSKTVAEKDMWIQHLQSNISKATEIKNIKSTR